MNWNVGPPAGLLRWNSINILHQYIYIVKSVQSDCSLLWAAVILSLPERRRCIATRVSVHEGEVRSHMAEQNSLPSPDYGNQMVDSRHSHSWLYEAWHTALGAGLFIPPCVFACAVFSLSGGLLPFLNRPQALRLCTPESSGPSFLTLGWVSARDTSASRRCTKTPECLLGEDEPCHALWEDCFNILCVARNWFHMSFGGGPASADFLIKLNREGGGGRGCTDL